MKASLLSPQHSVPGTFMLNIDRYHATMGDASYKDVTRLHGKLLSEADATFYLDLFAGSSNALFTKSRGVGTILNDD